MSILSLKVIDKAERTKAVSRGSEEVNLVFTQEYQEGDIIIMELEKTPAYIWLQVDEAIGRSLVYATGNITYRIPFGSKRTNISPKAFWGSDHLITAKEAKSFEINAYRNLSFNTCDQHEIENCYPHAAANVETRGETVFAAQNAIDGITANNCHGKYPYQSWGINMHDDARIHIDFGRKVIIDRIILYTRADFPHDNWWKEAEISFSDGSMIPLEMKKSDRYHEIRFEKKEVHWVEMHDMKKSDEQSPYPALTQIEIYGTESIQLNSEEGEDDGN